MEDQLGWPSLRTAIAVTRMLPPSLSTGTRDDSWQRAELLAEEILQRIQPTAESEERRKAVIRYVQKLLTGILGAEVLPFGSVPLKTYLPDGDIDLTAIDCPNPESGFTSNVISILNSEEQNENAEFEVKDTEYINAEVKLVKCLIQKIVVDISFNQIGGVATFCFLEMVDRQIGKNHLFKRSIILIKAWCYYESRILGAHHGLISTYALEMLILHIFNIFHKSLYGPIGVLFKFLDYFSKFDWNNYCVTLRGRVALSSLPKLDVESPEADDGNLLLSKEFMGNVFNKLSLPSRIPEKTCAVFLKKHMNIVDPLKETNNLGRTVSKGNLYRIRSALTYGARKLGEVLAQPQELMANELGAFFMNTLNRYVKGERSDVQHALLFGSISVDLDHKALALSSLKIKNDATLDNTTPSATGSREASAVKKSSTVFSGWNTKQGPKIQLGPKSWVRYQNADLAGCPKTEMNGVPERSLSKGMRSQGEVQESPYSASISRAMDADHKASLSGSKTGCTPEGKGDGKIRIPLPLSTNLSDLIGDLESLLPRLQAFNSLNSTKQGQLSSPTYLRSTNQVADQQQGFIGPYPTTLLQMNSNVPTPGVAFSPGSYSLISSSVPCLSGTEDTRTLGIGSYFQAVAYCPNVYYYNHRHWQDENWHPLNRPSITSIDVTSPDEFVQGPQINENLLEELGEIGHVILSPLSSPQSPHLNPLWHSQGNGFVPRSRGWHECGFRASPPPHVNSQQSNRRFNTATSHTRDSKVAPDSERPRECLLLRNNGVSTPQLKDKKLHSVR